MLPESKYKNFNIEDIEGDINEHGVARFKVENNFYSLYRINAIKFNLVHDNSEKCIKSHAYEKLSEALARVKPLQQNQN